MAKNDHSVVCDAGPLIHLHELHAVDLLNDFGHLLIPRQVWEEATRHRPSLHLSLLAAAEIVDVQISRSARLVPLFDSFGLQIGEQAALSLMEKFRHGHAPVR